MNSLATITPKLGKLIPMLSSSHDGEVVAAARAIERTLKDAGRDWHDLVKVIISPSIAPVLPETWRGVAMYCHDRNRCLNPREAEFAADMCSRLVCGGQPTERQASWLRAIYAKVRAGYDT